MGLFVLQAAYPQPQTASGSGYKQGVPHSQQDPEGGLGSRNWILLQEDADRRAGLQRM